MMHYYKRNLFTNLLTKLSRILYNFTSFGNYYVTYYINADDIEHIDFKNTFKMKLNDVGISRLKKELNINSKSYVSIIATNKDDEMCKITHAPDISHILCGDTLIWSVNDIKQRDVQKKFFNI